MRTGSRPSMGRACLPLRPALALRRECAPDLAGVNPRRRGGVLHAHEAVAHEPADRLDPALCFPLCLAPGLALLAELLYDASHGHSALLRLPEPSLPARGLREARVIVRVSLHKQPHEGGERGARGPPAFDRQWAGRAAPAAGASPALRARA